MVGEVNKRERNGGLIFVEKLPEKTLCGCFRLRH